MFETNVEITPDNANDPVGIDELSFWSFTFSQFTIHQIFKKLMYLRGSIIVSYEHYKSDCKTTSS